MLHIQLHLFRLTVRNLNSVSFPRHPNYTENILVRTHQVDRIDLTPHQCTYGLVLVFEYSHFQLRDMLLILRS